MRSHLSDDAIVDNGDLVGIDDGREAMRDQDAGAALTSAVQGILNNLKKKSWLNF